MPTRQAAIVSRTSPLIKRVKTLHRSTAARRREGVFLVEGIQPVSRALEAAWEIETLLAIVATSARAGVIDHWSVDYSLPMAAMFGSEGCGLPAEVIAGADLVARIPMAGTADSLNLAVACGVFVYEVKRRRCSGFWGSQCAAST